MAAVVQRWAQTPRDWLTALPVRARDRVAHVAERYIELLCDPATQPAPSAVAEELLKTGGGGGGELADDDNPHMSPRSLSVPAALAPNSEAQLASLLEPLYDITLRNVLRHTTQATPATPLGAPPPPPNSAKKRLHKGSRLQLPKSSDGGGKDAHRRHSSARREPGPPLDVDNTDSRQRALLSLVCSAYCCFLRCTSLLLPATVQRVLEFVSDAVARCAALPDSERQNCAEPMLCMFLTRHPQFFDTILRRAFGHNALAVSYVRAISLSLLLDWAGWNRRLVKHAKQ
jgi:hypothetical protein